MIGIRNLAAGALTDCNRPRRPFRLARGRRFQARAVVALTSSGTVCRCLAGRPRFPLQQPAISTVVPGVKNRAELEDQLAAVDLAGHLGRRRWPALGGPEKRRFRSAPIGRSCAIDIKQPQSIRNQNQVRPIGPSVVDLASRKHQREWARERDRDSGYRHSPSAALCARARSARERRPRLHFLAGVGASARRDSGPDTQGSVLLRTLRQARSRVRSARPARAAAQHPGPEWTGQGDGAGRSRAAGPRGAGLSGIPAWRV